METPKPLETKNVTPQKSYATIRFVVSGTPFDIPFAELENFPMSTLYVAATTKIGELARDPDGVPVIALARDVWAFRLLRHFIGCGELIVPSNETERQLLLAEAGFYGLEAAAIVLESFGAPTAPPAQTPAPTTQWSANVPASAGPRSGFSAPSKSTRLRYQVTVPAAERIELDTDIATDTSWALPRQTFAKVFTDEDVAIRAQEYIARVAFAADSNLDATVRMPWVVKFFGSEGSEVADGKAEVGDGKTEETPEFSEAPRDIAKKSGAQLLPPCWLGAASSENSDMYAKLTCPGQPVTHASPLCFVANGAEFRLNFRAFTLDTLGDILGGGLPVVAAGGCVLAALCAWPRTAIPTAKLLAEYLDPSMSPCHALLATRRFTQSHRRRYVSRYDDAPDEADPRQIRLHTLLERIHHLEDKLGLGRSALAEGAETPPPSIGVDDQALLERVAALLRVDVALDGKGANLIWKKAASDVSSEAGVCNPRFLRGFRAADIDLFLTTRDPDVAFETVLEVFRRLRRAVPASCPIEILRSANSVTFLLPWPYRTIQIVSRLYHSAAQVLLGFDLDCCCVAYDGTSVLALPRALRALRRGYNLVDPSRQSLTYESRLLKYARRGFLIAVPGDLDLQKNIAVVREKLFTCVASGTYLELRGFQLLLAALMSRLVAKDKRSRLSTVLGIRHSDYGPDSFRTSRSLGRHVRSLVQRGGRPPFALGSDPATVLLSAACVYTAWGRPQLVEGAVSSVIEFQTVAPHVQERVDRLFTGAFNPSSADWF